MTDCSTLGLAGRTASRSVTSVTRIQVRYIRYTHQGRTASRSRRCEDGSTCVQLSLYSPSSLVSARIAAPPCTTRGTLVNGQGLSRGAVQARSLAREQRHPALYNCSTVAEWQGTVYRGPRSEFGLFAPTRNAIPGPMRHVCNRCTPHASVTFPHAGVKRHARVRTSPSLVR